MILNISQKNPKQNKNNNDNNFLFNGEVIHFLQLDLFLCLVIYSFELAF